MLTQIDLLTPVMEWTPPYDWEHPQTPKEHFIHDAVLAVQEELGSLVTAVVPVCLNHEQNRIYGVEEWVLPEVFQHLEQVRATALLRDLQRRLDRRSIKRF